ncbi:FecR domain-containing protein [Porticoccaceae bacterium LTM1]|nr:FecR domain-containing protein [Porticoccaceae bacterium LTM1]
MTRKADKLSSRQADQMVARLFSGEVSEEDIQRVESWRSANQENQQEFMDSLHLHARMEGLSNHPDICAIAAPIENDLASKSAKESRRWPRLSMVAGLLLIVTAGLNFLWSEFQSPHSNSSFQRYVTRVGEQKTIELKDGSLITLNTATRLLVEITDDQRQVILEWGEAFFDVASDPERPFIVNVDSRTVSVLGTQFNLMKEQDKFTLAVLEGEVAIHHKTEKPDTTSPLLAAEAGEAVKRHSSTQYRVKAGVVTEYQFDDNLISAHHPDNLEGYVGWRAGLLRFSDEPLYRVVKELNRYSAKKILIEDVDIMGLKIYASVKVNKINSALMDLERVLPIHIEHYVDRIVLTGDKNSDQEVKK